MTDRSPELASLAQTICRLSYIEGDFLLRSGQRSKHYFDKYLFEADPETLRRIARGLRALVPAGTEVLGGLELGGVPIATALGLELNLPMAFVRKAAKDYGTMKLAEGHEVEDRSVLIVEDVVTSGGQVVKSVEALRVRGAQVRHALCVIDRESGGSAALAQIGVELRPLFTMSQLSAWLPARGDRFEAPLR
jgi:orotate phosphoribosyltransferase